MGSGLPGQRGCPLERPARGAPCGWRRPWVPGRGGRGGGRALGVLRGRPVGVPLPLTPAWQARARRVMGPARGSGRGGRRFAGGVACARVPWGRGWPGEALGAAGRRVRAGQRLGREGAEGSGAPRASASRGPAEADSGRGCPPGELCVSSRARRGHLDGFPLGLRVLGGARRLQAVARRWVPSARPLWGVVRGQRSLRPSLPGAAQVFARRIPVREVEALHYLSDGRVLCVRETQQSVPWRRRRAHSSAAPAGRRSRSQVSEVPLP